MRLLAAVALSVFVSSGCTERELVLEPNLQVPLVRVSIHGNDAVIFPEERAKETPITGKVSGYWTPSQGDAEALELKLQAWLNDVQVNPALANTWLAKHPDSRNYVAGEIQQILENYARFRKQYVGIVVNGSRRVYVNSFPNTRHDYWTDSFVQVRDGGFWYWNAQYDVETGEFLEFHSNGYA